MLEWVPAVHDTEVVNSQSLYHRRPYRRDYLTRIHSRAKEEAVEAMDLVRVELVWQAGRHCAVSMTS